MVDILSTEEQNADQLCQKGIELCSEQNFSDAHIYFQQAYALAPKSPRALSWFGYTTALVDNKLQKALLLCREATTKDVPDPLFYRNLGEVAAMLNNRKAAVAAFARGLRIDNNNRAIVLAWQKIGMRRKPPLSFLSRDHWINKLLGKWTWKK